MYHEVDPVLGPEMRSTGEVLGMANLVGLAFKAEEGTESPWKVRRSPWPTATGRRSKRSPGGSTSWGSRSCHRRDAGVSPRTGDRGGFDRQDGEGRAEYRRCPDRRPDPTCNQYAEGKGQQGRRCPHSPDGDPLQGALRDHAGRPWPRPRASTRAGRRGGQGAFKSTTPISSETAQDGFPSWSLGTR